MAETFEINPKQPDLESLKDENTDQRPKRSNFTETCNQFSTKFSHTIDRIFYRLGYSIASHPVKTLIYSFLLTIVCSSGYFRFHSEKNPLKLWIPPESQFLRDTEWLMRSFEEGFRLQSVLITAPDVLQPNVLKKLAQISNEITRFDVQLENGTSFGWKNTCFQIPIIASLTASNRRRKKRGSDSTRILTEVAETLHRMKRINRPFNPSVDVHPLIFCSMVDNLPIGCMTQNLLELWNLDDYRIKHLTKEDILNELYKTNVSQTTGHETNFERLLGGVTRDDNGHIIAAKGILSHWMVYVNFSNVNHDKVGNSAGTEDWVSEQALLWENQFLKVMDTLKEDLSDNETQIYYSAGKSYGDISSETMFQDMNKIAFGGMLMFIFMTLVLSKFGRIELRVILSSMGLLSVGMAFSSAVGICSFLGISYGPVHTSLPFLLMGLGVDDMFVIMACWQKVQREHPSPHDPSTMPDRIGRMLQMAGSSITITSFTDVVAFIIGSITILPSLESFCLYAGIGVVLIFIYVNTFVIAIFTLDEHRILTNRNAFAPCVAHKSTANLWCDAQLMNRFVKFIYTNLIITTPGKIIVLMLTIAVTAFSFIGVMKLEQKFDPNWFIPEGTYLSNFTAEKKELFPDQGYEAAILMGRLNYTQELNHITNMVRVIENHTNIVHEISSWTEPFHDFVKTYYSTDFYNETLTDYDFRLYLSKFLHTQGGGKYRANFRFKAKMQCGEPVPEIQVSTIDFKYRRFSGRKSYLPAMHTIQNIVESAKLDSGDGFATVWGRIYGNWVTDEVIDTEVSRNIMLALACVMFCTTVLIVNPYICFWIFMCVVLTLINVCGLMAFWGLTIDLVSCIGLELAVGLCVDYAAHVGHTFLVTGPGTKSERALETIIHIGPAVLYGGGSTLLAVSMMANSRAYTFQTFFKIFLLVITFGLFFGLVFLPVILSLLGPSAWQSHSNSYEMATSPNPNTSKHRTNKNRDDAHDKEMVSFIQTSGANANGTEKNDQKDIY